MPLTLDEQRRRHRDCVRRLRAEAKAFGRWHRISLEEIADTVGLPLSPQSSLDPRWWTRQMYRYHLY